MISKHLSLEVVATVLRRCFGTDGYALAKCNCIVNLVTILEVHLRMKVLKDGTTDQVLDGDFAMNLCVEGVASNEARKVLLSLLEIRNCFVHEGTITDISDQMIDQFIGLTKSILTTDEGLRNSF